MWGWFTDSLGTDAYTKLGVQRSTGQKIIEMYHGSSGEKVQESILKRLKCDCVRLVISTVAFGMGINIPDIR
jgi:superfamily II DNA helicase RecQ